MAQKITRKSLKHDEFVEAGLDVGEWVEEHWRQVAVGVGAVFAVALLWVGWNAWSERRANEASRRIAEGLSLLRPEALGEAPPPPADPSAAAAKFEEAARAAGSGPVGAVATYYRASALLAADRAGEARPLLETLVGSNPPGVLAGSAEALLAEALEKSGDLEGAASVLQRLAASPDEAYPPAFALVRLGEIRLRQGRTDDARRVFEDVLARFPNSAGAPLAQSLLEGLGGPTVQ